MISEGKGGQTASRVLPSWAKFFINLTVAIILITYWKHSFINFQSWESVLGMFIQWRILQTFQPPPITPAVSPVKQSEALLQDHQVIWSLGHNQKYNSFLYYLKSLV